MAGKRLSAETRKIILRGTAHGTSVAILARRNGCSRQTVLNVRARYALVDDTVVKRVTVLRPVHTLKKANEALHKAYGYDPLEELVTKFRDELAALKADVLNLSINMKTGEVEIDYRTHTKFKI